MLNKLSDMCIIPNLMCLFIGTQLLIHGHVGFSVCSKRHAWFIVITSVIALSGGVVSLLTRNK